MLHVYFLTRSSCSINHWDKDVRTFIDDFTDNLGSALCLVSTSTRLAVPLIAAMFLLSAGVDYESLARCFVRYCRMQLVTNNMHVPCTILFHHAYLDLKRTTEISF